MKVVGLVAAASVACFGGGWVAADAFTSPAQREAAARPPAAEPVVEAVVAGELADRVVAKAQVGATHLDAVGPAALAGRAVVTDVLVAPGGPVDAGTVVATVNGRPLLVVPGLFPLYRDLTTGDRGPDVAQLQDGLAAAGHPVPGSEHGHFGSRTARAVTELYRARGFEVVQRGVEHTVPATSAAPDGTGTTGATVAPVVPMAEIAVAPRLPAAAAQLPAVGAVLTGDAPVLTLASGTLVARTTLVASTAARIRPGMAAELVGDDQTVVPATVAAVDTSGADPVALVEPSAPVPEAWRGAEVLVRIAVSVVASPALLVPAVAVAAGPEGQTTVAKQLPDGTFTPVRVRELGQLGGQAAVEPVEPAGLAAGDRVRVG